MKVFQYCQHVLGIGHFFRSLEITRALNSHEVVLISGGPRPEEALPPGVREINLPGLLMDEDFQGLYTAEPGRTVEDVKKQRAVRLLESFRQEAPDVFLVELYPFGRKAFEFELLPVLQALKEKSLPPCRVVSSLRDVLVEKKDQDAYETRVLKRLDDYFDALLVHSDPRFIDLEATFSRTRDIEAPVVYTGFVTPKPDPGARARIRSALGLRDGDRLVLASAGGGKVGGDLLQAVVTAFPDLKNHRARLQVFTGPLMAEEDFRLLESQAGENVRVERFTPDFVSYLAAADLSVSMAGYNTTMNLLAARAPALVKPFAQNREQRFRAETLARRGVLTVLEEEDLKPGRLARLMVEKLEKPGRPDLDVDLNGAARTAQWLEKWAAGEEGS